MCTTKTCTKCGEDKPATLEYYPIERRNVSGLRSNCRICYAKRQREYIKSEAGQRVVKEQRESGRSCKYVTAYNKTAKGQANRKRVDLKSRTTIDDRYVLTMLRREHSKETILTWSEHKRNQMILLRRDIIKQFRTTLSL